MPEGIGALSDDAPAPPEAEPVDVEASPIESKQERETRILRIMLARALDVIPNILAGKYQDKRFALYPEERELGTDAWMSAIDALFPDLAKLSKFIAVLAAGLWTLSVAQTRMLMAAEWKRRVIQERRRRAAEGGAAAPGAGARPAPGHGPGNGPPSDGVEGAPPSGEDDEPESWHEEAPKSSSASSA